MNKQSKNSGPSSEAFAMTEEQIRLQELVNEIVADLPSHNKIQRLAKSLNIKTSLDPIEQMRLVLDHLNLMKACPAKSSEGSEKNTGEEPSP